MYKAFITFVRELYDTNDFIPLHAPRFDGEEKELLADTIDSTFVSTVGKYVNEFEEQFAQYTGAKYAVSAVNGTSALHLGLHLVGVKTGDEVITQALTFVATANAIAYCGAKPIFVDVEADTLGMSSVSLATFLAESAEIRDDGYCWNRETGCRIAACLPMHTFGMPANLSDIEKICQEYRIPLVEEAAEALGSYYDSSHVGHYGALGIFSFNGNKIITTGGGGMLVTDDETLAKKAKHLSTTAKCQHAWKFAHDELAYNYRMPNLNAALGVAQMRQLDKFRASKRDIAAAYQAWGAQHGLAVMREKAPAESNYWLNTLILGSQKERDEFLQQTNAAEVMTRPVWEPMHHLPMYQAAQCMDLSVTEDMAKRAVNVPSSALI